MPKVDQDLAEHPFLEGMDPEHVKKIQTCDPAMLTFEPDSAILLEGQDADACYLIEHGNVRLEIHAPEAGPKTLQTLHTGDLLGWSWLFAPYRWTFDARAITSTRIIALDGVRLRALTEADPEFGFVLVRRVAEIIVERLHATLLQLLDVYGNNCS